LKFVLKKLKGFRGVSEQLQLVRYFTLNKLLIATGIIAFIFLVVFWIWWNREVTFVVENDGDSQVIEDKLPVSSIAGIACQNYSKRPVAIMMSSDLETRPLSGISQADIVFEIPVTPSGITRIMAVFQCEEPEEIGSIRSARESFIQLAGGLGAIFVHWGGEKEALNKLNDGILDNIDAMKYETEYFYRKKGRLMPHNGFINPDKILKAIIDLGYDHKDDFAGYSHGKAKNTKNISNIAETLLIEYPSPFNIMWEYDPVNKIYKRIRGDKPEIDKNNGKQVEASVVVVIETTSEYISLDYLNVNLIGGGEARIYQNGVIIPARWQKGAGFSEKLYFYNNEDKEIELVPGKIWVEIITTELMRLTNFKAKRVSPNNIIHDYVIAGFRFLSDKTI